MTLALKSLAALLLALATAGAQSEFNPYRTQPQTRLADGTVLEGFRILSYTADGVSAAWSGGRGVIAYDQLGPEWGPAVAKFRPRPAAAPQPTAAPRPTAAPQIDLTPIARRPGAAAAPDSTVTGQCFIVTKGRENVKLGEVRIAVYPREAFMAYRMEIARRQLRHYEAVDVARADTVRHRWPAALEPEGIQEATHAAWLALPTPDMETMTDADGNFTVRVPGTPFILFAHAQRRILKDTEHYLWIVPHDEIAAGERLLLSNRNLYR